MTAEEAAHAVLRALRATHPDAKYCPFCGQPCTNDTCDCPNTCPLA